MKAMKFKVTSPEHSKDIQEKLFEMGYAWGGHQKELKYLNAKVLYAGHFGDNEITYDYTTTGFDINDGQFGTQEHFLDPYLNQFVTKDYYTQPTTAPKETTASSTPLTPRKEHRVARMFALLRAMQETLADGKGIVAEWAEELLELAQET